VAPWPSTTDSAVTTSLPRAPPEARGRGIAGGLTTTLLERATDAGCSRAVLHSTDTAVGVYRRAGFVDRCPIQVFATASLWSDQH